MLYNNIVHFVRLAAVKGTQAWKSAIRLPLPPIHLYFTASSLLC